MSTDLQCQQAAHQLLGMIERRLNRGIDHRDRETSATLEPDDIDRVGFMVARLERLTRGLEASEEGSELRHRYTALEKRLAAMRTSAANAALPLG